MGGIGCNVAAVQNVRYIGMCLSLCCVLWKRRSHHTHLLFLWLLGKSHPTTTKHHQSQTCPFFVHNHDHSEKNLHYLICLQYYKFTMTMQKQIPKPKKGTSLAHHPKSSSSLSLIYYTSTYLCDEMKIVIY